MFTYTSCLAQSDKPSDIQPVIDGTESDLELYDYGNLDEEEDYYTYALPQTHEEDALSVLDQQEGIVPNDELLAENQSINNGQPTTLLVTLAVNYEKTNLLSEVLHQGNDILIPLDDLKSFNIKDDYLAIAAVTKDKTHYIDLAKLTNTTYNFNESELSLEIYFPAAGMNKQTFGSVKRLIPDDAIIASATGAYLNYDLVVTNSGPKDTHLSGIQSFNFSNDKGYLKYDFFTSYDMYTKEHKLVRLDTNWTVDKPEKVATWRIGDIATKPASWSGGTRIFGAQYSTNFSINPAFITHPLLAFAGKADLPSMIDIYSNSVPIYHANLKPGDFEVLNIPGIIGSGDLVVRTQDITGKMQTITIPYYIAPTLLKAGISEYSYEVGAQRLNYGMLSNTYQHLVTNVDYMYGVNDYITEGFHIETLNTEASVGVTGTYQTRNNGAIEATLATNVKRVSGAQIGSLSYSSSIKDYNIGTSISRSLKNYRNIYSGSPVGASQTSYNAFGSYNSETLGSFFLTI